MDVATTKESTIRLDRITESAHRRESAQLLGQLFRCIEVVEHKASGEPGPGAAGRQVCSV